MDSFENKVLEISYPRGFPIFRVTSYSQPSSDTICNDQTSKDLSLCAYRASPWIELASTHSIDEYQNSKCIIYYNVWSRVYKIKQSA